MSAASQRSSLRLLAKVFNGERINGLDLTVAAKRATHKAQEHLHV